MSNEHSNIHLLLIDEDGETDSWGYITRLTLQSHVPFIAADENITIYRRWFQAEPNTSIHPSFDFYSTLIKPIREVTLVEIEHALKQRLDIYHEDQLPHLITDEDIFNDYISYLTMAVIMQSIDLMNYSIDFQKDMHSLWFKNENRISRYRLERSTRQQLEALYPPFDVKILKGREWAQLPFELAPSVISKRAGILIGGTLTTTTFSLLGTVRDRCKTIHQVNFNEAKKQVDAFKQDIRTVQLCQHVLKRLLLFQQEQSQVTISSTKQLNDTAPACMIAATNIMTGMEDKTNTFELTNLKIDKYSNAVHLPHESRIAWFDYMLKASFKKGTIAKLIKPKARSIYGNQIFDKKWKSIEREIHGAEHQVKKQNREGSKTYYTCNKLVKCGLCPHYNQLNKRGLNEVQIFSKTKFACSDDLYTKTAVKSEVWPLNTFDFTSRALKYI